MLAMIVGLMLRKFSGLDRLLQVFRNIGITSAAVRSQMQPLRRHLRPFVCRLRRPVFGSRVDRIPRSSCFDAHEGVVVPLNLHLFAEFWRNSLLLCVILELVLGSAWVVLGLPGPEMILKCQETASEGT